MFFLQLDWRKQTFLQWFQTNQTELPITRMLQMSLSLTWHGKDFGVRKKTSEPTTLLSQPKTSKIKYLNLLGPQCFKKSSAKWWCNKIFPSDVNKTTTWKKKNTLDRPPFRRFVKVLPAVCAGPTRLSPCEPSKASSSGSSGSREMQLRMMEEIPNNHLWCIKPCK